MNLVAIVAAAVMTTSFVSGVLGMGGGLMLMGVYGAIFPVAAAMVLHGITQLVANGSRAFMLREHVAWRVLGPYAAGAVVSGLLASIVAWVPDRATVYLALGVVPFLSLLPARGFVDVSQKRGGFLCGLVVTAAHLIAGVSGPLLDLFFIDAPLDRRAVVATKAVTQSFAHLAKVVYFGVLSAASKDLGAEVVSVAVMAALLGTALGKRVLHRLSDDQFRKAGRVLLLALGSVYLWRGFVLR